MGRAGSVTRISKVLLLLGVAGVTVAAHGRISLATDAGADGRVVPRPELLRIASLGFDALVADYYWIQAVQVVGASAGDPSEHGPLLGRLIDVVTKLDPWVGHPYRFAAIWMVDTVQSIRFANEILQRGIAYHPLDWRNRFYLGFNQFYFLDDHAAAIATLEPAVGLPGAPRYLARLVARLRLDTDGLEASALFLQELVRSAPDGYAAAEYEKSLDEVETERRARVLDAARQEYGRRHGRDIARVEDLIAGAAPVLRRLPPEPNGWEWTLDPETGRILSTYYGVRYEVHRQGRSERLRQEMIERSARSERGEG
jgi:hypothetical protein